MIMALGFLHVLEAPRLTTKPAIINKPANITVLLAKHASGGSKRLAMACVWAYFAALTRLAEGVAESSAQGLSLAGSLWRRPSSKFP